MIKIKYSVFVYLHKKSNSVMVRVRWDNKKEEVTFATGCIADPSKWKNQCAVVNTTHKVGEHCFTSRQINNEINKVKAAVEQVFSSFELHEHYPNKQDLKEEVAKLLGKDEPAYVVDRVKEEVSLKELFDRFTNERKDEKLWDEKTKYKYGQIYNYLMSCDKNLTLSKIDKKCMITLRNWFLKNNYQNATIVKAFRNFRCFLKWAKQEGYEVNDSAISYRENISIRQKKVIFLKFEELLAFYNYKFSDKKQYLTRARDMFCFMAFTSLRYSDLKRLKVSDVSDDHIEIYTEKTDVLLNIPLVSYAKALVEKYKGKGKNGLMFPVISNKNLNDYIKEAAKEVGLNRQVVQVSYSGNTKHETVNKLCDITTCHVARKTFVCSSIHLGIPQSVVMKCTGHSDYRAMRPYIEVADETTARELAKWELQSKKVEIGILLEKVSEEKLDKVLKLLRA